VLVLLPLIFTEALPKQQLMTLVAAPPPPPPSPPAPAPVKVVKRIQSDIISISGQLRTPTKIPEKVQMIKEEEAPPPEMSSAGAGVPGGVPGCRKFAPSVRPLSRHTCEKGSFNSYRPVLSKSDSAGTHFSNTYQRKPHGTKNSHIQGCQPSFFPRLTNQSANIQNGPMHAIV